MIVIHYTAMASAKAALDRLCDPVAEVSAHYLIGRDGTCWQMVDEAARAWHAGAGSWGDVLDVNSRSIGIELDNNGQSPFSAPMMDNLEVLLRRIMKRWAIPPERVIGHSDMAPGRKADPGPRFDWRRLARLGLSVWPEPKANCDVAGFSASMSAAGYPDAPLDLQLSVLRDRFRPWAQGPLDGTDAGIAADLAQRFAIDRAGPSA
ncbi:N-acetylmuramoyl-L-alanine amidase [Meridianimarinicoccus aquatilis]|uniref:N-acetylmuramoyl-L-alanine amidase n=1 Tax=Meridianimarinicoccus aquatilis TaxID=2552766 RepID=A0A4V3BBG3_9RHOB|nr:N-acetylmuramoyl-L-alanine amidase [Fluviibacterium aquatile]QIE42945.1 N-acetylmuramoyl-L-alanine amidase [Rhodobacteraceae bacterium SC52]TDL86979.1 N-acetylmuramoyl-L-alanine amidase [Fluviibacterium aquatile]